MINKVDIVNAIVNIEDPDLNKTFAELNAIKEVTIEDNTVKVYIELVQPIFTVYEEISQKINEAIVKLYPSVEVEVNVSERMYDLSKRKVLKQVKNIIAVASGKGGVGKSSIAANLTAALHLTGARVGILDGDVYGPSQPTMFGLNEQPFEVVEMPDGTTMAFPLEKYGIKVASMGMILQKNEAAIVRGPLLAGYFSMLFEQIEWGELDYLVFDLPPGTGDVQLTLTQKIPLTGAIIVTTPQEIAVADVRRSIAMFRKVNVEILGVVENMSYFIPPDDPSKKYYIFGEGGGKRVCEELGVDFLGEVPFEILTRESNDSGMPVVLREDAKNQREVFLNLVRKINNKIRKRNFKILQLPAMKISI
ncbi:iron-sulfur cluster carrier protein ApbC [Bacteroidetes/Chlorobi group bacterium Naka2016]|jgi:ATP-binding protein involved in chromosome partitioning|nr:MAG: iron-sulfur cluster carrier protein ApbC [Bacteroidetes/Chlorobi group bacterium Naka2016]